MPHRHLTHKLVPTGICYECGCTQEAAVRGRLECPISDADFSKMLAGLTSTVVIAECSLLRDEATERKKEAEKIAGTTRKSGKRA